MADRTCSNLCSVPRQDTRVSLADDAVASPCREWTAKQRHVSSGCWAWHHLRCAVRSTGRGAAHQSGCPIQGRKVLLVDRLAANSWIAVWPGHRRCPGYRRAARRRRPCGATCPNGAAHPGLVRATQWRAFMPTSRGSANASCGRPGGASSASRRAIACELWRHPSTAWR
jgi:hypothetical protein